jgi:hypothetical protein
VRFRFEKLPNFLISSLEQPRTLHANSLAFLAAWAYRDSESYRILSDGFGHWMRPVGALTLAGLLFLPLKN